MKQEITGNRVSDSAFMSLVQAIISNVHRNIHTADIVLVKEVDDTERRYKCTRFANLDMIIYCTNLQGLQVKKNDIMLCIFTDTDYRKDIKEIANRREPYQRESETLHSLSYGILVGLVYRGE